MKWKAKKLLSVTLIFSLILSLCLPNNVGSIFASDTSQISTYVDCNDMCFKVDLVYSNTSEDAEQELSSITVSISDTKGQSEVSLPTLAVLKNKLKAQSINIDEYNGPITLTSESDTVLSGITTLTIANGDYPVIPSGLFNGTSIQHINITSNSNITFENSCFSNMTDLNDITVTADSIVMKGNVFFNCNNLKKAYLTSQNTSELIGGYNFSGCSSLNKLDFNCPVKFSGSEDFCQSTFSRTKSSYVNFQQTVTNSSSSVFSKIANCDLTISFRGKDNNLSNYFIYNSDIKDLNILGNTTFGFNAISDSDIKQFTLNADTCFATQALNYTSINNNMISNFDVNGKVTFSNQSFCNVTIDNLTFNVENTKENKNLTYSKASDRLGYDTKVNNLYFDSKSSDGVSDRCTELRDFPLGNGQHSSLNIDNIYFLNPNFKYIGGSDYKRCDNSGITNVYGYGGSVATDESGNYITGYDMYKNWTKDANCIYKNYMKNAETLDYTIDNVVYLPEDKDTYTYDFSSTDNICAYASYIDNQTPYKDINAAIDENGRYPLAMTTDEKGPTNFNYRILKPDTSASPSEKYVYTDSNGKKYTTLTTTSLELSEGVHEFLLEAGGVKHSFKINVRANVIDHIESITPVEGDGLHLNIGDTLTKDMINVNVCYANQAHAKLSDDEYEILNPEITGSQNEIIIQLQLSSTETIQKSVTVYGYSQNATGFEVSCHQTTLTENSTLSVSDVELHNVTFENPNTPSMDIVKEGFHFVVDGKEVDEVTIKQGENKISVTYKNYVYKDALTITGTEPKVSKVWATYIGKGVYENCAVPTDSTNLLVYIYTDSAPDTPILVTDTSKLSFGAYQIVANKENNISVYYNGVKAEQNIVVPGLKDDVAELTSAQYVGETSIGTILDAKNFSIDLTLLSGKKLNSSTNPELLEHLTFSATNLTNAVNVVNVIYNGQFTKTITIFAYGTSTPTVTATVPATTAPPVVTNTPIITTTPTVTSTPVPTEDVITDTAVPIASGDTPLDPGNSVPPSTDVPVATTSATQTPTDIVSTVKKGNTYVVNNVKYKVLSIKGTLGTASIVGYVKSAKSVSVKTSVKIRNCTLSVVSIGKNAFKNCSVLKGTVKLSGSITSVGSNAFYGCRNVTSIIIGTKLKKIGSKCFYNCKKLKKVDLTTATKLSSVGRAAFKNNSSSRVFKIASGTKKYFAKLLKGKY